VEQKGGLPDSGGSADDDGLVHAACQMVKHGLDTRGLGRARLVW
jgi:hypothetical protein